MRMWNIPTQYLCKKHLLGEHVECHMLAGCILKDKNIQGYIDKGLVELDTLDKRHSQLAYEMLNRGYQHSSQLPQLPELSGGRVDILNSYRELMSRCKDCSNRIMTT